MACWGHSATHVPHPWQFAVVINAALPGSALIAPYGHLSTQIPHLAVLFRHLVSSTMEMIGSIFHFCLLITVAALDAAPLPCETLYGISFRPWQAPAQKTPSVGASIGLSLGWDSMKNPSERRDRLRMRATSSEPFLGMAAVVRTTMSASTSIGFPRSESSE